jgi:hypothetical protein
MIKSFLYLEYHPQGSAAASFIPYQRLTKDPPHRSNKLLLSLPILETLELITALVRRFRKGSNGYDSMVVLQEHYDRGGTDDFLSRVQYVDIKIYLPGDVFTKIDRASMAVSRSPRAST